MNISEAKQVLLRTHKAALSKGYRASGAYLESGPGIGKTEGTFQYGEALAKELNQPVGIVQFMLATITSPDVRGFMLPVRNGASMETVFSTPPWYPTQGNTFVVTPEGTYRPGTWLDRIPEVGILFLDEFAQAEEEVKKPAAELIYKGNVGTCALPDKWRVVAAGNRTSDRSGVMRELMFLVNRRCLLSIDPHLPTWVDWANRQPDGLKPHYMTISFARQNPDIVFKDEVPQGTEPFCTPRTLCMMDRDLQALRSDQDEAHDRLPIDDISREVAGGWIGKGATAQFYTHLKYADQLPEIDHIEKDPMQAKLPKGRDVQMVCSYMLAHHLGEKNARNVFRYIERMDTEMQVLAVRAMSENAARVKYVTGLREYTNWLVKNQELLIASNV
jgi:hypothetical protein